MSSPAALNPDALRAAMIAGEAECREYGFRGPHDGIYEVAIRAYLSALPAPSAVAGDGLVERLQRPWDGSSGSRDRRDAERREAATLITELQAKVARMEVEAFDAATAHGKTKLALAKSEASREAAEAMVAEARKVINELIRTCRPEPIIFDTGEAALRAARTWMEGGR